MNAYMAFAVWLDEPKLLCDLVGLELLPPAIHQGLGSDLIIHQALCSQADCAALTDRGGRLQVCVSYSLQRQWWPTPSRPVTWVPRVSEIHHRLQSLVSYVCKEQEGISLRPFPEGHHFLRAIAEPSGI